MDGSRRVLTVDTGQDPGEIMLPYYSIKALYPLALAEGEGIGTAYEYFAKRLALGRWLKTLPRVRRLLIAGLPEKYGSSLDFIQIAQDLSVPKPVVVDDRLAALEKLRLSVTTAQAAGALAGIQPEYVHLDELAGLRELNGSFDLCLGSEVLQRMNHLTRSQYVKDLCVLAPAIALFAPNGGNHNHTTLSGLSGLELSEVRALAATSGFLMQAGYVDMPPFPPGLTRSDEQRTKASAGRLEALAMGGLGYYARLERSFPAVWRRAHAHIVYGFIQNRSSV
jgi:hypothetical protein